MQTFFDPTKDNLPFFGNELPQLPSPHIQCGAYARPMAVRIAACRKNNRYFRRSAGHGLHKIALPFSWCIEGNGRRDIVGEINNTADIMETCIIMGRHSYPGYYAQAEQILRAHFLLA